MYSNRREREEERGREPDVIDGHMLMFLMHHLRRRARRQVRTKCTIIINIGLLYNCYPGFTIKSSRNQK